MILRGRKSHGIHRNIGGGSGHGCANEVGAIKHYNRCFEGLR